MITIPVEKENIEQYFIYHEEFPYIKEFEEGRTLINKEDLNKALEFLNNFKIIPKIKLSKEEINDGDIKTAFIEKNKMLIALEPKMSIKYIQRIGTICYLINLFKAENDQLEESSKEYHFDENLEKFISSVNTFNHLKLIRKDSIINVSIKFNTDKVLFEDETLIKKIEAIIDDYISKINPQKKKSKFLIKDDNGIFKSTIYEFWFIEILNYLNYTTDIIHEHCPPKDPLKEDFEDFWGGTYDHNYEYRMDAYEYHILKQNKYGAFFSSKQARFAVELFDLAGLYNYEKIKNDNSSSTKDRVDRIYQYFKPILLRILKNYEKQL